MGPHGKDSVYGDFMIEIYKLLLLISVYQARTYWRDKSIAVSHDTMVATNGELLRSNPITWPFQETCAVSISSIATATCVQRRTSTPSTRAHMSSEDRIVRGCIW